MPKVALVCILLVLAIAGSQWIVISRMRCYLVDTSIADMPVFRAEEAALWAKGMFQSETAPEEMTVIFDGKTYTGSYAYSICTVGKPDVVDYYRSQGKNALWGEFGVIAENGELSSIHLAGYDFLSKQSNKKVIERQEVAELAQQWAARYIDTDQYVMRQTQVSRDSETNMLLYGFEFVRAVGGRDTTDKLYIQLTDRGELCQIGDMQTGWVKGKMLALFRLQLVNVEEKLQDVMGEKVFQIRKCYYGITPEGKPVILVDCSVAQKSGNVAAVFVIQ